MVMVVDIIREAKIGKSCVVSEIILVLHPILALNSITMKKFLTFFAMLAMTVAAFAQPSHYITFNGTDQ